MSYYVRLVDLIFRRRRWKPNVSEPQPTFLWCLKQETWYGKPFLVPLQSKKEEVNTNFDFSRALSLRFERGLTQLTLCGGVKVNDEHRQCSGMNCVRDNHYATELYEATVHDRLLTFL